MFRFFQIFLEKFKVPSEKIVICGNPFIERVNFKKQVHPNFTITFVAVNWAEEENKELLTCFLSLAEIESIKLIVKLRPKLSYGMLRQYQSWTKEINSDKVEIISKEDMSHVLRKTDLVVTYNSGVVLEAMACGVPAILLDIFTHIDLRSLTDFYDDCVIVKNKIDLHRKISEITASKDVMTDLINKTMQSSQKYFNGTTNGDAISLLAEALVKSKTKSESDLRY